MLLQKKKVVIGLALIPQMILVRIISGYPEFIETYYSNGLYPIISKGFRYVFGWIPFSFGDVFYVVLIFLILRALYQLITGRFRKWKEFLWQMLAVVSIVYFSFHLLWGLNYYRLPLHKALQIENEYSTEELVQLTEKLIVKSNFLHSQLAASDTLPVAPQIKDAVLFEQTLNGYRRLQTQFPKLDYPPKSIKQSLLSYPLSIMGYSGYLNPITNEGQINALMPPHRHPVVSCHEQAHQLGFAKENEANFIGVMAALNNESLYFQYSASIFALRYCLSDLYKRDEASANFFRESIHVGIFKNYAQTRDFWLAMENPLEPLFKTFYNGYLEANNQPGGMATYSYMVALLVNYNKAFPQAISR